MRQLLLTALGAAGSLLVDLPALAQLSNTTSTFTAEVPASCAITNLEENYVLPWSMGGLRGTAEFTISANSSVSISANYEQVQVPGGANPTKIFRLNQGNTLLFDVDASSKSEQLNLDSQGSASLSLDVVLYKGTIYNSIPPGNYAFRVLISCLQ